MTAGLYLASQSPRRRELLSQIGVPFTPLSVAVPEVPAPGEHPEAYVQRLALDKARAGWAALRARGLPPLPVLGADTLGVCAGQILEKPRDANHAADMLRQMAGREHQVLSALALVSEAHSQVVLSTTRVWLRALSEAEIAAYWATGEPADKAGGYAIQGLGAVLVERIEGSYSGVVGLPIEVLVPLLRQFHIPCWQSLEVQP